MSSSNGTCLVTQVLKRQLVDVFGKRTNGAVGKTEVRDLLMFAAGMRVMELLVNPDAVCEHRCRSAPGPAITASAKIVNDRIAEFLGSPPQTLDFSDHDDVARPIGDVGHPDAAVDVEDSGVEGVRQGRPAGYENLTQKLLRRENVERAAMRIGPRLNPGEARTRTGAVVVSALGKDVCVVEVDFADPPHEGKIVHAH